MSEVTEARDRCACLDCGCSNEAERGWRRCTACVSGDHAVGADWATFERRLENDHD